jgi:aspartokinase
MERMKIGGLKLSFALGQFELTGPDPPQKILSTISKVLSAEKINIEFLTYSSSQSNGCHISLCVSEENFLPVSKILQKNDCLPLNWDVISREMVGMVTIFPYQSALSLLGIILVTWRENYIPIYGVATSLSAISVLTDFLAIDKVVEVIQGSFQLPDNHAPLKPEFHYDQSNFNKQD